MLTDLKFKVSCSKENMPQERPKAVSFIEYAKFIAFGIKLVPDIRKLHKKRLEEEIPKVPFKL